MCEASAYIEQEGKEELIMESVDIIKPEGEDKLLITNIFGDQKILYVKIKTISLINHKIVLEKVKE